VIFVGFAIQNLPASIAGVAASPPAILALGLVGVIIVAMLVAVRRGEQRWRAAGLDLDGREPLPPLDRE
jgi:hypothetical protein